MESKEGLLWEDAPEGDGQLICVLTVVRSLNLSFPLLKDFVSGLTGDSFANYFCGMGELQHLVRLDID